MRKIILAVQFFLISIAVGNVYSHGNNYQLYKTLQTEIKMDTTKIKIKVNAQTFTALLYDNEATRDFLKILPLELKMNDLHSNEKYADLPKRLPTQTYSPNTIETGNLMLFGSQTIVLFYKTFSTTYRYTKLGSIDDPKGLASALGKSAVNVTFER